MGDLGAAARAKEPGRNRRHPLTDDHRLVRAQRHSIHALALAVGALMQSPEPAQASAPREAQQLFNEGIAGIKANNFERACPLLEESYRLEPNLGALLAHADCLDRWGKLRSAELGYEHYVDEVSELSANERRYRGAQLKFARDALARLLPAVPRVLVVTPEAVTPDSQLFLDDEPLFLARGEKALSVDPGAHAIEVRAAGHAPWRMEFDMPAGHVKRIELQLGPSLTAASAEPPPTVDVSPSQGEPAPARGNAVTADAREAAGSTQRSLGWTLGAVGLAGLTVGAVTGVLMLDACPRLRCTKEANKERHGMTLAYATDVSLGVGVLGLVASAILLATAPERAQTGGRGWQAVGSLGPGGAWVGVSQPW
jgi:hypothetical protein